MPIKRSCENISFSFKWGIFFFEYLGRRIEGENWFKFCGGKEGSSSFPFCFVAVVWLRRWFVFFSPPFGSWSGASGRALTVERRRKKTRRGGFFFKRKRETGVLLLQYIAGGAQQFPHTNNNVLTLPEIIPCVQQKKREKGFYSGIHCEDCYHCRRGEEGKN